MDNKALFKIGYGLYVLTAKDGERDNGCILNTVMQVTAEPNRIAVCVSRQNLTHDMIEKSGMFNVSVISEKADFELFKHFGFQSGHDVEKFFGYSDCERSENGVLYITKGTNAYISGNVVKSVDLGTHTMFIADVSDMKILCDEPSATYDYYFEHIKPKPEEKKEEKDGKKRWRCVICGYEYVGDTLPADFICPICKHPASDFELCE